MIFELNKRLSPTLLNASALGRVQGVAWGAKRAHCTVVCVGARTWSSGLKARRFADSERGQRPRQKFIDIETIFRHDSINRLILTVIGRL